MLRISEYRCLCDPCGRTSTITFIIVGAMLAQNKRAMATPRPFYLFWATERAALTISITISFRATAKVAHTEAVKQYDIFFYPKIKNKRYLKF